MADGTIALFYSYSDADEDLRKQLENHLTLLKRQGLIHGWHKQEIGAGNLWQKEVDAHLKAARIILLLVSPDYLASDYSYGVEMQDAIRRQVAGEARVIPILLRPCDWESAPFGGLQVLPRNRKPVRSWPDTDEAFAEVAREIRAVVEELNDAPVSGSPRTKATPKKRIAEGGDGESGGKRMAPTPTTISPTTLKKAIATYYKELEYYQGQATHELGLRSAFQNLLANTAHLSGWRLSPEETLPGNIRPDGVLRGEFDLKRGYWEAKGPKGDLEREIAQKITNRYPLTNTIFENTTRAVLYQNKRRALEVDLRKPNELNDLLRQFLTYVEPDIENFETAVEEFKGRIPELAGALLAIIEKEARENKSFTLAFEQFAELCRQSLNPQISREAIKEMLIQHLLTERLFRTVFHNPDFIERNVIAAEIEKVIRALTSRAFNRQDFLRSLDRFYVAIESAAKGIENWSERQHFLNTVYERFFQGFSIKQADTFGIVYTPQEIVDFMCASVEEILRRDFDKSLGEPGVKILDPATGTGNFIVNLIRNYIPGRYLREKYRHDLFCNEIMLLPYYIASLNIEHEYFAKMGHYASFEGICFADTLELAESQQLSMFAEENTTRVQQEKDAEIMVVMGNPPYNVGQQNEMDNNKNRKYPVIDRRIYEMYTKGSKATNTRALSDAYVKFFRWATDRLQGKDGIVCFISNNGFFQGIAFDGFRKRLAEEFTQIYHFDLGGDMRKQSQGNVFGISVGVGITVLVRCSKKVGYSDQTPVILYHAVENTLNRVEKLALLKSKRSIVNIEWSQLQPDSRHAWITEGIQPEFAHFLPLGAKEDKALLLPNTSTSLFKIYSGGVKTNRDNWSYDFSKDTLSKKIQIFISTYNSEVDRWGRRGTDQTSIDNFVTYDDTKIKWSESLKLALQRRIYEEFSEAKIQMSLYRPFCKKGLYFDRLLNERVYQLPQIFSTLASENENIVIVVSDHGHRSSFSVLATDLIPDIHLLASTDAFQCFPYYTYASDGTARRENITEWALAQFQAKYGPEVTKWDIFHYVYGMLHHPQYRERYAENLKRDLPHIPLLHSAEAFRAAVGIGKQLMDLHLNYEQAPEYKKLEWLENRDVPFSCHVEKMRLSGDKRVVVVNESLRLGPVPPECFEYRLGNRSALEWVLDQYQVSEDKRSGIKSDPNRADDPEYIVRLVGRVVQVSVETVRLVGELALAVKAEDWLTEGALAGIAADEQETDVAP